MSFRTFKPALILAVTILAAACAGPGAAPKTATERAQCFVDRDVENWESINTRTVILHVRGARSYAVEVFNDCSDIDWSQTIGLANDGRRLICPGDTPTLIVPRRARIGSPECNAISLKAVTAQEIESLKKPKG